MTESSGRFERLFFKIIEEEMTAGAGGAFGDGPSTHDISRYGEDSAIVPKMLGAVQTRKGPVKRKRKNKKKNSNKGKNLYLTGENEEIPEEDAEKVDKDRREW